jgi:hypothetical protein
MRLTNKARILVACCLTLLSTTVARALTPFDDTPYVTLIQNYTQFGANLDESLGSLGSPTVQGNLGVSNNGKLHIAAPFNVYGNVYVGMGASYKNDKADGSNIHGSVFTNQNLTAAQNQIYSDSATFAAFAPDQTFTTLNTTQSFTAPAGFAYVVNITNLNLNNQNITFSGLGYLVLNISGSFSLTGTASILAVSGTPNNHIFVNYTGTGTMTTHVGDEIDGRIFIPRGSANLDGTFKGHIYSGQGLVTLLSGARVISQ